MEQQSDSAMEMSSPTQELYKDGVLTLGCIGIHLISFTGKCYYVNAISGSSLELYLNKILKEKREVSK